MPCYFNTLFCKENFYVFLNILTNHSRVVDLHFYIESMRVCGFYSFFGLACGLFTITARLLAAISPLLTFSVQIPTKYSSSSGLKSCTRGKGCFYFKARLDRFIYSTFLCRFHLMMALATHLVQSRTKLTNNKVNQGIQTQHQTYMVL